MPRKLNVQSNPRLLDLLKMGARIILPNGRYLSADTEAGYIQFGFAEGGQYHGAGGYKLSRQGLRDTLSDRDFQEVADPE